MIPATHLPQILAHGLALAAALGALFTLVLLVKSVRDFSRTGPQMSGEVLTHYRLYLGYAMARLVFHAFAIATGMAFVGVLAYAVGLVLVEGAYQPTIAAVAAAAALVALTVRAFLRTLLGTPGLLAASSHYSMTHFYSLWEQLTPARLRVLDAVVVGGTIAWLAAGVLVLAQQGAWLPAGLVVAIALVYAGVLTWANWEPEPRRVRHEGRPSRPNILLVGSDTLRADRVNGNGYGRDLMPALERFSRRAARFTDCYVPCARTAPSIVCMLTGTWPHTNGIRDTFVRPEDTRLPVPALPEILKSAGYTSAIVGDWAASDAEKFNFGFDHRDLPDDQWNMKYLLRQGPKDLRLFLSLFTQNRYGKTLLPEIHFLGGVPLTEEVGRDTRHMLAKLAQQDKPFFVVSFMATTHPPFTSKYPYYALFADRGYRGESKFNMAKLRDPFEIIRRQGEPRTEFDLDQIIDLYDGCVRNFDDELGRILAYLDDSGLAENTIVGVFSDHGMEFFEHETWGQGNSAIGDFSARVPFVLADPRQRAGITVSEVVRTVDIAPTLLELVGLPVPPSVEGISLVPLMRGEPLREQLPAFYETGVWLTDLPGTPEGHLRYPHLPDLLEVPDKKLGMISLKSEYLDIIVAAKDRMVRVGDWKLTYQPLATGALYQLFNVRDDPGCRENVISRHPRIAERLERLLAQWMAADPLASRLAAPRATTPAKAFA